MNWALRAVLSGLLLSLLACSRPCSDQECAKLDPKAPLCGPEGRCAQCLSNADCNTSVTTPICDSATRTCRGCEAVTECRLLSPELNVCSSGETTGAQFPANKGACVGCEKSTDCHADAPVCHRICQVHPFARCGGSCSGCATDFDCEFNFPATPVCESATCSECSARSPACPAQKICDTSLKACVTCPTCPSYAESTIPRACEDMSSAMLIEGFDGGMIGWHELRLLPANFAFSLFGTPVTHFSVRTSGMAQLWRSASEPEDTSNLNPAIPKATQPNNLIAPYWSGILGTIPSSTIKTLTTGTAPQRRFTIEWANFALDSLPRLERFTFQAQLLEGTGRVEFHYCELASNGGDALTYLRPVVGLEDFVGVTGVVHPVNGPLDPAVALRFTPTP